MNANRSQVYADFWAWAETKTNTTLVDGESSLAGRDSDTRADFDLLAVHSERLPDALGDRTDFGRILDAFEQLLDTLAAFWPKAADSIAAKCDG